MSPSKQKALKVMLNKRKMPFSCQYIPNFTQPLIVYLILCALWIVYISLCCNGFNVL